MSQSDAEGRAVPPPSSPPPPASAEPPAVLQPPAAGEPSAGAPEPVGEERQRALRTDLDEVARAHPERAFNVGAVLGILLALAAVVFVVQNNHATDFEWLWFDFSLPLWTVLVGSLVLGALAVLAGYAVHRQRRRRIARRRQAAGRLREALPGEPEVMQGRRRFGFRRRTAEAG